MGDDLVKKHEQTDYEDGFDAGRKDAADRIGELERENQLQAQEIDKTRDRADKWQSMVIDCEKYLKPGETPRQRMDRDHADVLALMKLLEKEKYRAEAAEAKLAKAINGLKVCRTEIDGYVWLEYPGKHPAHDRCRKRDFDANPARITLAELGEGEG